MQLSLRVPLVLQSASRRAILYMLASALGFALVEFSGTLYVRHIDAPQLVWSRYAVHLLFMVAVLGPRFKTRLYQTRHIKLQIVRSLTMVVMPVCFLVAATHMPINDVWAVYWLAPAIMLALSILVLHEPVGTIQWAACAAALVGALLFMHPDRSLFSPYALFALGMGFAIALHLTLSRVLRDDHPLVSLFHTALWAFLAFLFFLPFVWKVPTRSDLFGIVLVGIIGMASLYALARSGELVPLSVVAVFSYTELIWDLLLKGILLHTPPGKSELAGALLIAVVTAFLLYREYAHPYPDAGGA